MQTKAQGGDFDGRFREIIGDPLNLLIRRDPEAGMIDADGCVVLHNGHRVPQSGPGAYYGDFSRILIYNRGVHEPLEEFAFQCLIPHLPIEPVMLELGAYWAHYSMWMAQVRPKARLFLIEPMQENLQAGQANFARNGYHGHFTQGLVQTGGVEVDSFMQKHEIEHLVLLHSDIQGYEGQMLDGARKALTEKRIDYLFISTHSQMMHKLILDKLTAADYRIEVSSDVDHHTTSFDGLIMASAPSFAPILADLPKPLGREDLVKVDRTTLLARLLALSEGTE